MNKIACIFCFFVTVHSFAQDSSGVKQGDIYRKWPAWRIDGRKLTAKEFKQEIYKVPTAIPYYKKSQTNLLNASFASIAGAGFLLLGKQNTNINSSNFGKSKPGYLILALLSEGVAIHFIFRSSKNMKTAVRLRNEHQITVY